MRLCVCVCVLVTCAEESDAPTCWRDVTNDMPLMLSDDEASFKPEVAPIRLSFIFACVISYSALSAFVLLLFGNFSSCTL